MKRPLFVTLAACVLGLTVNAQGDAEDVVVPKNETWLREVDLTPVPNIAIRPEGSGICEDAECNGPENDECFETCGNTPTPEDIYGCPRDHHWALTFDDGPSEYTEQLLDLLDEHQIKATFCVMGAHVEKYPATVKRAYEAGHQIASHTYSHPHLMSLTNEEIIYEIKATEKAIKDAIGIKPKYVRPPFGEADGRVKALLKAMGYKVLLWNVDPTDYDVYMRADAGKKIRGAFQKAAAGIDTGLNPHEDPGYISLQHDLYNQSISQVPHVISYLKKRGYQFTTAADCLGDKEPHDLLDQPIEAQNVKSGALVADAANSSASSAVASSSSSSSPSDAHHSAQREKQQVSHVSSATTTNSLTGLFVSVLAGVLFAPFYI